MAMDSSIPIDTVQWCGAPSVVTMSPGRAGVEAIATSCCLGTITYSVVVVERGGGRFV
jgi:hypothetical protein